VANDLYEALVQEIPLGVLVVQANGTISVVNTAALELFSLPRRVAERSRLQEVLPEIPPELLGQGVVSARMRIDDREVLFTARPFQNGTTGRLITMRDVTSQTALDRVKVAFVSDLLHKIRTPLTTIKSGLSTMASGRFDPTQIDTSALVEMSRGETDRLVRVLDDIRDLFLVDTGLLADELETVDLDALEIVEGIRNHVLASAAESGLDVPEVNARCSGLVRADARLLERAIRKIIENAVHYTPEGGRVSIALGRSGNWVEIVVADTGPGMPEDVEMRAFDRFFRGASAPTHVPDGIGIGLTLARDLVRIMGGEVQLETEVGKGTRIAILLPPAEDEKN